ncbi:MAG: phosphoribosyltransferase [Candidatus Heimdallarchaeota archaeon]|nr:phosphoribosyltransferase [Candidatus Heimdallarchaeota archaeon]MCK5048803.1 phosphoribosyltransferase [Candidatus Heimdallarchaeota archaeon]
MITPVEPTSSSIRGYQIKREFVNSDRCYLIESIHARKILTNPFLGGPSLISLAKLAVKDCLEFFFNLKNQPISLCSLAEVVPLSGSLTYDLMNAFYDLFGLPLKRNFVGIRRKQEDNGEWNVETSYTNFEGLTEDVEMVLIGDTIATGVTLSELIKMVQEKMNKPLEFVIISIAGTLSGSKKLVQIEKEQNIRFPGTKLWCLFTEAYFGLEENGTDMPINHPDSIACEELKKEALPSIGSYLSRHLCSILDWGKRTNAPKKHLLELLHSLKNLQKGVPDEEQVRLEEMIQKCNDKIYSLETNLIELTK